MKLLPILALCALPLHADVAPKDAAKAMLQLYAYDNQGQLLRRSPACYTSAEGRVLTTYSALIGAARVEVVDFKGRRHELSRVLGANSTTDLAAFTTRTVGKGVGFFALSSTGVEAGTALTLLRPTESKKAETLATSVVKADAYNAYRYYEIAASNDSTTFACPLIDAEGHLVAFAQRNVTKGATTACAIDARFSSDLQPAATSVLNSDLRALNLPKALPTDAAQAMTYIYMIPATDSLAQRVAYDDYIAAFPAKADGYMARAAYRAKSADYQAAGADYQQARTIAASDTTGLKVDAIDYAMSDMIYRAVVAKADTVAVAPEWSLQRASQLAAAAYAANPQALYLMQQGRVDYASGRYREASDRFVQATKTPGFATPETYYSAAIALEKAGGDSLQVLALVDSCIAAIPEKAGEAYGAYYIDRAQRNFRLKRYRESYFDFTSYEHLVGPSRLTPNFYYLRYTAALEARMYQQALDDIHSVIATTPKASVLPYRLDEAALLLRVGELNRAREAAHGILKDYPGDADALEIVKLCEKHLGAKK